MQVDVSPVGTLVQDVDVLGRWARPWIIGSDAGTRWRTVPGGQPVSPPGNALECAPKGVFHLVGASFIGGRYWIRTSDPFGVNEVRYHCANRPCESQQ